MHRTNSKRLDGTIPATRGAPAFASMIVVELNLGCATGCFATDPVCALAQQVAGKQSFAVFVGDDFPRRRLPLGNYQSRTLVSYPDVEIELVKARLDLSSVRYIADDLEHLHDTEDGSADDVTPRPPAPALLGQKPLDRIAINVAGPELDGNALPDANAHNQVQQHGRQCAENQSII
jgi:hypothetical protein